MKTVAIAYAKAHLSAVLDRVRAGHSIVITDRGTPIARLEPLAAAPWDARLRSLVERGLATAPTAASGQTPLDNLPPAPTLARGTSLIQAVLDEREEGW